MSATKPVPQRPIIECRGFDTDKVVGIAGVTTFYPDEPGGVDEEFRITVRVMNRDRDMVSERHLRETALRAACGVAVDWERIRAIVGRIGADTLPNRAIRADVDELLELLERCSG